MLILNLQTPYVFNIFQVWKTLKTVYISTKLMVLTKWGGGGMNYFALGSFRRFKMLFYSLIC